MSREHTPANVGHVIEFAPTGEAQAMHNDKFDLSFLGKQAIYRATEIKFREEDQTWSICEPVTGPDDVGTHYPIGGWKGGWKSAMGFKTYEGARQVEVAWLNSCRLRGCDPSTEEGLGILLQIREEKKL